MACFHTPTASIISALLLLFPSFSTISSADWVRDYTGNPMKNGGTYTFFRNDPLPDEGPIVWANFSSSKPCPLYVLQWYYPFTPTSFLDQQVGDSSISIRSPLKSLYIPLNSPIQISFNDKNTPCNKPLKWSVKPAKPFNNSYYLVAGYDNPRYKGYFKVIDAGIGNYVYRLLYCLNNQPCLEVGNAANFPKRGLFGITSDPKSINFWAFDFYVSTE